MVRLISAAIAAFAITIAVAGGLHSAASAAAPYTTPTPVALQYEEISRFAIPPASPEPPGFFQDDRQAIMANASAPAAQHHGLFGNIVNGYQSAMSGIQSMQSGILTRLTYYHNWVRTDDVVRQTATIVKCDLHQYIQLDLAHHTYTITSTLPSPQPAPQPGMPGQRPTTSSAPGTVDMTVTATRSNLGPRTLESVPTKGDSSAVSMAMTNATGSCNDGSFSMRSVEYISNVGIPRAYCPLPRTSAPSSPQEYMSRGGCVPRIHGSASGMAGMGGMSAGNRLAMYRMAQFGGAQTNGQMFGTVTVAGNVRWLYKPEADALFSIPPGFTRQQ
jgi:hypothetical protein